MNAAGKVQIIIDLLGGQPLRDENGDILLDENGKVQVTAPLITAEEALKLLDQTGSK